MKLPNGHKMSCKTALVILSASQVRSKWVAAHLTHRIPTLKNIAMSTQNHYVQRLKIGLSMLIAQRISSVVIHAAAKTAVNV